MKNTTNDRAGRTRSVSHSATASPVGATAKSDRAASTASAQARRLALAVAASGLESKASGVEIIDVCAKVDYTEFVVLMSGRSDRHVLAIATSLQRALKETRHLAPLSVEGMDTARWVLVDYNDVVVHIFQEDTRLYYDLEGLWIDASRVGIPPPRDRTSARPPADAE